MLRCIAMGAIAAVAAAAPMNRAQISHKLTIPALATYGSELTADGQIRKSFVRMFESRMQKELDMPAAALQVTAINYSGERINARRRVQSDESVTINYVVKCGADGCLDEKSKLENIDSTQMTNIIQAIDDHAFKTGFGTSATCSGQSKADCAASAIANLEPPGVVSINLFTGAPTVSKPPTPKPTPKISLCVSANPCFTATTCADAGDSVTCGACPSGYSGDGKSCVDVDDCGNYTGCGAGTCKDAGTNANTCACPGGYAATGSPLQVCDLVNQCAAAEDDCVSGATCNHVSATVHTCTCPTGTEGDGFKGGSKCADINGCIGGPCDALTACSDKKAPALGYTCAACPKGYTGTGAAGCTDVDDCAGNPCAIGNGGQACQDQCTKGFTGVCAASNYERHSCTCLPGYAFFGSSCRKTSECHADIGETCPDSTMTCSHDAAGGSFACNCGAGMEKDSTKQNCVEKNDCVADSCYAVCHDTKAPATGFTCDGCPKGYRESWANAKQQCTDIDDCGADNGVVGKAGPCGPYGTPGTAAAPTDGSTLKCVNKPGVSHSCQCKAAYKSSYHCADMSAAQIDAYATKLDFNIENFNKGLCKDNEAGAGLSTGTLSQATGGQVPNCATMKVAGMCSNAKYYNLAMGYCVRSCFGNIGGGSDCSKVRVGCDILVPLMGCKATITTGIQVQTPCQKSCNVCGEYCDPLDNCVGAENDCDANADCNHQLGNVAHSCTCKTGFTGDGKTCSDTNGCATNPCDALTSCSDVAAPMTGYTCSACPAGYSGTGKTSCNDIDDCKTSAKCVSPDTKVQLTCVNAPGVGYSCDCGSDYFAANGTCYIKNRCALNPCHPNADCNAGSKDGAAVVCSCKTGYNGDGTLVCADTNGCANSPCDALTVCSDAAAPSTGFSCSACPPGYTGSGVGGCSDIDDCVGNPCGSGGTCSNDGAGTGKWKCSCSLGYQSVFDNADVTDKQADFFGTSVDGKTLGSAKGNDWQKSGRLAVPKDGFSCSDAATSDMWGCKSNLVKGYWFGRSYAPQGPNIALVCRASCGWAGPICATVDACTSSNNCDSNADCAHVVLHGGVSGNADHSSDSYTCTCKADRGFVGDGKTCKDDNACASQGSGPNRCGSSDIAFGNTNTAKDCCNALTSGCSDASAGAGWSASSQFSCGTCPSGYTTNNAGSGQTCTDIADCKMGDKNLCGAKSTACQDDGAGTGRFKCTCTSGYVQDGANGCKLDNPCIACAENNTKVCEDDCVVEATCSSQGAGKHSCTCQDGYFGTGKQGGTGCTDINECTDQRCYGGGLFGSNARLAACRDSAPGASTKFTCAPCPDGYSGNGVTCADADDCAAKPCGQGKCTDTGLFGWQCACPTGYVSASVTTFSGQAVNGEKCDLNDPCLADEDDCYTPANDATFTAACAKTGPGVHSCTCPVGTEGDGKTSGSKCTDSNACATQPCSSLSTCTDDAAPGTGFTCGACPTGYTGNGVGDQGCVDTNECSPNPCATLDGAGTPPTCTDKAAPLTGYRCDACPTGYDNPPVMPALAICNAAVGTPAAVAKVLALCKQVGVGLAAYYTAKSFNGVSEADAKATQAAAVVYFGTSCKAEAAGLVAFCPSLSQSMSDALTCQDTAGCTGSPCNPLSTCTDNAAPLIGFACSACPSGYIGTGIGAGGCTDIDDCAQADADGVVTNPCGVKAGATFTCTDKGPNTYSCACPTGYSSFGDALKPSCAHVNACASGEDDCVTSPAKATCNHDDTSSANAPKHTCTCPAGFSGDGTKSGTGCADINGCLPNQCATLSGAGTRPACTDKSAPAGVNGFTCADCPTGYANPAVPQASGALVCMDDNACANNPAQNLCLVAVGTPAAAAQVAQLCKMYGVGPAASMVCDQFKKYGVTDQDCKDVATYAVTHFKTSCAAEVAGLTAFCPILGAKMGDPGNPCNSLVSCTDQSAPATGYTCGSCPTGYEGNGVGKGGCTDVDGCAGNPCPTLQRTGTPPACTDKLAPDTGFTCAQCPTAQGYDADPVGNVCVDTNGCKSSPCDALTSCTDVNAPQSGFTCSACPSGYSGSGKAGCVDINDCLTNTCGKGTCTDSGPNTYTCACSTGYTSAGTGKPKCIHADACASGEDDCIQGLNNGASATCAHDADSPAGAPRHTCTCPKGYSGDGKTAGTGCSDVNACDPNKCATLGGGGAAVACTDGTAPADPVSGFTCDACPTGYDNPAVNNVCLDSDGCKASPCNGLVSCTDQAAPSVGYTCGSCPNGWQGDGVGAGGCTDADDCTNTPCGKGTCTDTGTLTYTCACPTGYTSGTTCTLNDPCAATEDDCVTGLANGAKAQCNHAGPGQHSCTCPTGYVGNGRKGSKTCTTCTGCVDPDGCEDPVKHCLAAVDGPGAEAQVLALCAAYGVKQTGFLVCKQLKVDDATCKTVAATAAAHFSSCAQVPGGLKAFCPQLAANLKAPQLCPVLPSGGSGVAPKCSDKASPLTGFACSACPTGYNAAPKVLSSGLSECVDTDACAASPCWSGDGLSSICADGKAPSLGFTCGACPSGYSGNGIGASGCTDVDDCANNACGAKQASCTDTGRTARTCTCATGYSSVGATLPTCQLAHVCDAGEDDCVTGLPSGASASCNHLNGVNGAAPTHSCTCPKGYVGDGTTGGTGCADINGCAPNPCATLPGAGGPAPACTDILAPNTGATCSNCPTGYNPTPHPDTNKCVDPDGCAANPCSPLVTCSDQAAPATGYTCSACPAGYYGDGETANGCLDVDDCASPKADPCGTRAGVACKDAGVLTYTCTCPSGYKSEPESSLTPSCQHFDACASDEDNCVTGLAGPKTSATCLHIPKSSPPQHTCQCPAGYQGDGTTTGNKCVDRNHCHGDAENLCVLGMGGAAAAAQVLGLCKSYGVAKAATLTCMQFAKYGITAADCVQVAAFAVAHFKDCDQESKGLLAFCPLLGAKMGDKPPCPLLQGKGTAPTCTDKAAPAQGGVNVGYTCSACPTGYDATPRKIGNVLMCGDTNACAANPCSTLSTCADLKAPSTGFTCTACPTGYSGTGIGADGCKDVDDCDKNACGAQATDCQDTGTSSRKCSCKAGYSSVGTSLPVCTHTDACKSGENDCAKVAHGYANYLTWSQPGSTTKFPYSTKKTPKQLGIFNSDFTAVATLGTHYDGKNSNSNGDYSLFGNNRLHLIIRKKKFYMGFYGNDCNSGVDAKANDTIAFVYDKGALEQRMIINGVLRKTCKFKKPFTKSNQAVTLGAWGGGRKYKGAIHDAKIFKTAMDAQQLKDATTYLQASCNHVTGSSPPKHTCTCPSGYVGNGRTKGTGCKDKDECKKWLKNKKGKMYAVNPCPLLQGRGNRRVACSDAVAPLTGYTCAPCPSNFDPKPVNNKCIDTNGCNRLAPLVPVGNPCDEKLQSCFDVKAGNIRLGPSTIRNRNGAKRCVDASQRNKNGGKVHYWSCNGKNKNQQWDYNRFNGQLKIRSGKCLDASQRNNNGGKIHMWGCNRNNMNQQWTYDSVTGQIKSKNGICLDAGSGAGAANGGKIHMWTCNTNNKNQQWDIQDAKKMAPPPPPPTVSELEIRAGGSKNKLCMDFSQRTKNNGGLVHLWTCNKANKNQHFLYVKKTGTIRSTDGHCLNAAQRNKNGGKVNVFKCNGGASQRWDYNPSTGQIKARSAKCLDASGSKNGGTIHMWGCNTNNKNQQWKISSPTPPVWTLLMKPNGKPAGGCLDNGAGSNGAGWLHGSYKNAYKRSKNYKDCTKACFSHKYAIYVRGGDKNCRCADTCARYRHDAKQDTYVQGTHDHAAPPTFQCGPCKNGYSVSGPFNNICTDIDDCKPNPCGKGSCKDSGANQWKCTCPGALGLTVLGTLKQRCVVADPCKASVDDCVTAPVKAKCVDHTLDNKQHTCQCPPGYAGNGKKTSAGKWANGCKNYNACTTKVKCPGVAGKPGKCIDDAPPSTGYKCEACPTGYDKDAVNIGGKMQCKDTDGCASNPCFGSVTCTDAKAPATGATCGACPSGMAGDGLKSGTSCKDIDDCANKAHCQDYYSHNNQAYTMRDIALPTSGPMEQAVVFSVKAGNDAHLGFFSAKQNNAEMYEIVLSGWGNKRSQIRARIGGDTKKDKGTKNLLNRGKFKQFWASAKGGLVRWGKGKVIGKNTMMSWQDPKPHKSLYLGLKSGWGSDAQWNICGEKGGVEANCGTQATGCKDEGANKRSCSCNSGYNSVGGNLKSCKIADQCKAGENDCTDGTYLTCKDYNSINNKKYTMRNIPLAKNKQVIFSVKAKNDAHIGFFADAKGVSENYEIVLGGWGNKRSQIRDIRNAGQKVDVTTDGKGKIKGDGTNKQLLNGNKFIDFWASAMNGLIQVGMGKVHGQRLLMSYQDPKPHEAKYVGLKTGWGSGGNWKVCGAQDGGGVATCNHISATKHSCTCAPGYDGDGKDTGSKCSDLDACATNKCPVLQGTSTPVDCKDLAPPSTSFTCAKCPTGYDNPAVNNVCQDTNACTSSSCYGGVASCKDKAAPSTSFSCAKCPAGKAGNGIGANGCTEIDDCNPNPCGQGSCKDGPGATWQCACPAGYSSLPSGGSRPRCVVTQACTAAVDDCVDGLAGPQAKATCTVKKPDGSALPTGQHRCICPAGFTGDGTKSGTKCTDIDGCSGVKCGTMPKGGKGAAPKCTDQAAPMTGYTCSECPIGFDKTPVNGVCKDTNMCTPDPCNSLVTCKDNTAPSVTATCGDCPSGYTGSGYSDPAFGGSFSVRNYYSKNTGKYAMKGIALAADKAVVFEVKAKNDAHIGFFEDKSTSSTSESYEIVLGGWGNTRSQIRDIKGGGTKVDKKTAGKDKLVDPKKYMPFWASCKNGLVQVGKGKIVGQKVIMSYQDKNPHVALYIGLKTGWGADGRWKIYSTMVAGCTDIDDCAKMPCGRHAGTDGHADFTTCTDTGANKYSCTCPAGFTAPAEGVAGVWDPKTKKVVGAVSGRCAVINKCTSGENNCVGAGSLTCKDYKTFNNKRYVMRNIPLSPTKEVVFQVKAKNDAHIGFFADAKGNAENYEIVLGGWGNKRSQIRDVRSGGTKVDLPTDGQPGNRAKILDGKKFKSFWASALNGLVKVGWGNKVNKNGTLLMSYQDPKPHVAKYVGLKTGWGSAGDWSVCSFPTTGNFATCNHVAATKTTPVKHTCSCGKGFSGNGRTGKGINWQGNGCTDTNGCKWARCAILTGQISSSGQNKRLTCIDNKAPATGFTCPKCPAGYDAKAVGVNKNGAGGRCKDTDGCKNAPCGTNRKCADKKAPQTGYTCGQCKWGYKLSGKNCVDIDDCARGGKKNPVCGQGASKCSNLPGPNWKCTCKTGYTAVGNRGGQSCFLANACSAKENNCVAGATCNHINHAGYMLQFKDTHCKDYYSRNTGKYTMRNIALTRSKAITFSVKASNDAHIGFFSDKKGDHETYEIVLSGWGNKKSVIRESAGGKNQVELATKNLLNKNQYRKFWASAQNGLVRVGKGSVIGKNLLMKWQDPKPHTATYIGLKSGWGSDGRWKVCGQNKAEYELRVNTPGGKAGKYTISAMVKYDTLFNGNMMVLHTRWYNKANKAVGTTSRGTPAVGTRKRNGWIPVTTTITMKTPPKRLAWYIGYPQSQDKGNSFVTGVSIKGPGGEEYIPDGDFAAGKLKSWCRSCSYGNYAVIKGSSPVGPAQHTCQCPKGKSGDGYTVGTGCKTIDGCKGMTCARLQAKGVGTAPKCTSSGGVGKCGQCPPGYQPQPKNNVCWDADDCSKGKAAAGYAATKCQEGRPGSGKYTVTCAKRFKLKTAGGKPMCMLDDKSLGNGGTCSATSTEAAFNAKLKALCVAANLGGC